MRFSLRLPPWPPTTLLIFISLALNASTALSQPQNIEVFFPGTLSPPPPPFTPPRSPPPRYNSKRAVGIAVGVTAAATLLISALVFFLISRCRKKRKVRPKVNRFSEYVVNHNRSEPTPATTRSAVDGGGGGGGDQVNAVNAAGSAAYRFGKFEGNLKGLIVDENGLDVVYWRKLEGMSSKNSFKKEVFKKGAEADDKQLRLSRKMSRRKEPVQEIPLLRGKSSTSHIPLGPDSDEIGQFSPIMENHNPYPFPSSSGVAKFESLEIERQESITIRSPPHPPSPPPVTMAVSKKQTPAPPQPPPVKAPPPPPPPKRKNPPPPPNSVMKPPPAPHSKSEDAGASSSSSSAVKLKPLHWDKVNANVEHSMVWDKIDNGSFR